MMKAYKYQDETFQLDDSKGCYVQVTYKYLTGYLGVNLAARATDQNPYVWDTDKRPEFYVTLDGLKYGFSSGVTFEENLDALCRRLLQDFRLEEAAKKFDRKKYCAELHDRVKNLPGAERRKLYSLK